MIAVVAHELRSPLSAILGWARLARQHPTPERVQQALDAIERNAMAQSQLLDNLYDLSAILARRIRLSPEPTSLPALLSAAVETMIPAATPKDVRMQLRLDPSIPLVMIDRLRFGQIMGNLLANAIKFTPRGGLIEVACTVEPDIVEVSVADDGIGMPADFLHRAFDPFTQGHALPLSKSGTGVGLGLAIVRHLVELHDGKVHAASCGLNQGTTITIQLPRQRPS